MKLLLFLTLTLTATADLLITWPPVIEAGVAGYRLHSGPTADQMTDAIDVGSETSATISTLPDGPNWFRVTLYSTSGLPSEFSPAIRLDIDNAHQIDLQESLDGRTWQTVATLPPPLVVGALFRIAIHHGHQPAPPFYVARAVITPIPIILVELQANTGRDWHSVAEHRPTSTTAFYRARITPNAKGQTSP